MLFHFFLAQSSPLVDRLHRFKSQFVAPLLLRQPFDQCLPDDPALAAVNPIGNLVHSCDEIVRKLRGDYAPVISHFTHQSRKIKSNNIQYQHIECTSSKSRRLCPPTLDPYPTIPDMEQNKNQMLVRNGEYFLQTRELDRGLPYP